MKKIILSILFICYSITSISQTAIAKLKFEDAEEAYNNSDYETALKKLAEAENIFGKINPPILYLRTVSQYKLFEKKTSLELLLLLKNNCKNYLNENADNNDLADKVREIYKINEAISEIPTNKVAFDEYAGNKISEIKKEEIAKKYEAAKIYVGDMIFVEGGNFAMGNAANKDEKPVRNVTVSSFYIAKFEVTNKQWKEVMGSLPTSNSNCDDCPVGLITWTLAQDYINKINQLTEMKFRLPTEAEWEFAARGGNKSKGFIYSGSNDINDVACYSQQENSLYDQTSKITNQPVGKLLPNELGIFDMSGNASEWCSDWYANYNPQDIINPQGPPNGKKKVARGGSGLKVASECTVTKRFALNPSDRLNLYQWYDIKSIGIRLVSE